MLQLMIERRAPAEQLDGAVRALTAQGCRCGWPFAADAASALTALTAYAAISPPEPGHATVTRWKQYDRQRRFRLDRIVENVHR